MKKLVTTFSFLSTLLLTSCSSNEDIREKNLCSNPDNLNSLCEIKPLLVPLEIPNKEIKAPISYNAPIYFPYLPEYTEQLAYELKLSLNNIELDGSIAVSNFVLLSDSIRGGSTLGRQVAELLSSDLQNHKLPTSVASLNNYIDITEDKKALSLAPVNILKKPSNIDTISLSKSELEDNELLFEKPLVILPNITYICTGTLMETKYGVLINAKVIHRQTHKIVASANKILPLSVLNVELSKN